MVSSYYNIAGGIFEIDLEQHNPNSTVGIPGRLIIFCARVRLYRQEAERREYDWRGQLPVQNWER